MSPKLAECGGLMMYSRGAADWRLDNEVEFNECLFFYIVLIQTCRRCFLEGPLSRPVVSVLSSHHHHHNSFFFFPSGGSQVCGQFLFFFKGNMQGKCERLIVFVFFSCE